MKAGTGVFLSTGSYAFISCLIGVVTVDLVLFEVGWLATFHQGASIPLGTALLAMIWLQTDNFGRESRPSGGFVLAVVVVSSSLVGPLYANLATPWFALFSAGLAGGVALFVYWILERLVKRFPDFGAAVFAGPIAIAVGLANLPRLVRGSSAPRPILVALGLTTLLLLAVVLVIDGLIGPRGRLKGPGFVLLGLTSVLGLLSLLP